MAAGRLLPSFEALASQAPQDEALVVFALESVAACFNGCWELAKKTSDFMRSRETAS